MGVTQQVISSKSFLKEDKVNSFVDVLTFAEGVHFCGFKLYPVQRFLLKLVYGLPLSDNLKEPIVLTDDFNENIIRVFKSEVEFSEYLYSTNRLNSIKYNYPLIEIYLFIGRRGSKTVLADIIAAYSLYQLNTLDDPYNYFGVLPINEIEVSLISNNEENAERQSRELANLVYRCPFFKPFLIQKDPPVSGFNLKTVPMLNSGAKNVGKLAVSVKSASPSVRGASNIVVICDEFAHFNDSEASTKKRPLDEYIYTALTPSIANFRYQDGSPFGKAIFITSPNGKKGRCWKVYDENRDNPDRLVVNIPSWWGNPGVAPIYLKTMYKESDLSYRQEYGAEFTSQTGGSINFNFLDAAREPEWENTQLNMKPRYWYYAGLDLALSSDAASIVVCHFERGRDRKYKIDSYKDIVKSENVYVVDYVWAKYPDKDIEIQVDEIVSTMVKVSKVFGIRKWSYDQWSAKMFKQWLMKSGFKGQLEEITASQIWNSDAARLYKMLVNDGRLVIPDDDDFFNELFNLTETVNRSFIKLENPSGHDDRFSAMLKALWSCYNDSSKVVVRSSEAAAKAAQLHNRKVLRERICRNAKGGGWSSRMVR